MLPASFSVVLVFVKQKKKHKHNRVLGKTPKDLNLKADTWAEARDSASLQAISQWSNNILEQLGELTKTQTFDYYKIILSYLQIPR